MTEGTVKRVRTCIGCGSQSDKVQLLRIVRAADGDVRFDPTGRVPGRGAYVCSIDCLSKALASRKLQRALRCGIEQSSLDQVIADVATWSAPTR